MGARDPKRLLSKTEFKKGLECPRRLAYAREGYPSTEKGDAYKRFLSEAGYMVESLARALYPAGQAVHLREGESPAAATKRMLDAADSVDLFEAVFEHEGCSARVDILSRRGDMVELIEIKAASFDSEKDVPSPFRGKRGRIDSDWRPYLQDIAFQARIVRRALGPRLKVVPKLCIVDSTKPCTAEAVFCRIELLPEEAVAFGMPRARFLGDPAAIQADNFLSFQDVSGEVDELLADDSDEGVEASARRLAKAASDGRLRELPIELGVHCRDCEYRSAGGDPSKDGFRECWGANADASPHILDLYKVGLLGGRGGAAVPDLIKKGVTGVADIPLTVIGSKSATAIRQRVQVESVRGGVEWRAPDLDVELTGLRLPFHFVDFETAAPAVPYHAGMSPYGSVAFQFSCHTMDAPDVAELRHTEWINTEDSFPNVRFARALRRAIGDEGHMLVWSDHERTILRSILVRIRDEVQSGDAEADGLAEWLTRLTVPHDERGEDGEAGRTVDLFDICRKHYYHPKMGGKNSIKAVLKAVWQENRALHGHRWFQGYLCEKDGKVLSPYEALPPVDIGGGESMVVRDGTAAMRAYQDMLYGPRKGDAGYRAVCRAALLQYCKLDTLAMVMVWVHWASNGNASKPRGSDFQKGRGV